MSLNLLARDANVARLSAATGVRVDTAWAAFPFMTFITIILFGMDAVAQEIQDPFGFDDNDLNVQGYESRLFFNAEATIEGKLRIRSRDFAASSTHVKALRSHVSGASELMGVEELDAGLERKENLWSLTNIPWKIHGKFDDMTSEERKFANRKNNALRKLQRKGAHTESFQNAVSASKRDLSKRNLSPLAFEAEENADNGERTESGSAEK